MIEITPEILGAGIDEEYSDASKRIADALVLIQAPHVSETNDTFDGRMILHLKWLRQEIEARRLPIPLDRKYRMTLCHQIAEGRKNRELQSLLEQLNTILKGTGLVKPRHIPLVLEQIHSVQEMVKSIDPKSLKYSSALNELTSITQLISNTPFNLPINIDSYPGLGSIDYFLMLREMALTWSELSDVLFSAYRPKMCIKPGFAAPMPGLRIEE